MVPERISDRTVPGVFFRQVDRLGERTVVRYHDGERWRELSWTQMAALVRGVAAALVREGVAAGERVLLIAENRLEWLCCDLGIMTAGAVTVPVYPTTATGVAHQIADNSQARLAIVSADRLAQRLRLPNMIRMDEDLQGWLTTSPRAAGGGSEGGTESSRPTLPTLGDTEPSAASSPAELEAAVAARAEALAPDEVATIVYTSGTTGEPKGVMLAHRNLVDMARSALQVFDVGEEDAALSFLPYAHVFERMSGTLVLLVAGGSLWLSRGMDRLVDDLHDCRPTVMVSVPRMYEKMHQRVMAQVGRASRPRQMLFRWALSQGRRHSRGQRGILLPLADRLVLSPLRERLTGGRLRFFVSGGAPLGREVEEFFWSLDVKILNGWGMTETSSGATSNTERRHKFETVGPPLPGVEVQIASDGEVLVKGPGSMLGYFRNAQATAETLDDGWIRTGDIGELDQEGFLRITDRKKDLIKTAGGKFVAPQPLEARLQREPLVERAVILGDERPYVVALIVPDWEVLRGAAGTDGDPQSLVGDERVRAVIQAQVDALNRDLGSWERIKQFKLLPHDFSEENGELTPTLKVKRRAVEKRYREMIEEMYGERARPAEVRR